MRLINKGHSISSQDIVSTLRFCSIPVSMFDYDDDAMVIKFYGDNFNKLLQICGCTEQAHKLMTMRQKANALSMYHRAIDSFTGKLEEEGLETMLQEMADEAFDMPRMDTQDMERAKQVIQSLLKQNIVSRKDISETMRIFNETIVEKGPAKKEKVKSGVPFSFDNNKIVIKDNIIIEGEELSDLKVQVKEHVDHYCAAVLESYKGVDEQMARIERLIELAQKRSLRHGDLNDENLFEDLIHFYHILIFDFDCC